MSNSQKILDLMHTREELKKQRDFQSYTIPMPWRRLSDKTRAMKPKTVFLLGGPSKVGKSLIAINLATYLYREGWPWAYLPLEDSRSDWKWRALAVMENSYELIDDAPNTTEYREIVFQKHQDEILSILANVTENPRVGKKDENGKTVVPPVPWQKVLKWIEIQSQRNRVVFVDCLSQIEFRGRNRWEDEENFIRQLLAVAADSHSTIVILGHTVKRPGIAGDLPPTVEDIQGSAMWGRLLHTVILVHGHDQKKSDMLRTGGAIDPGFEHNRTVIIGAARNGSGTRTRLAFRQGLEGPTFEEIGVIAPKKRTFGKRNIC